MMEQLIVTVTDKEQAQMLSKFLTALNFVTSVEIKDDNNISDKETDFFSLVGLWEHRNISTEAIRKEAWRENIL